MLLTRSRLILLTTSVSAAAAALMFAPLSLATPQGVPIDANGKSTVNDAQRKIILKALEIDKVRGEVGIAVFDKSRNKQFFYNEKKLFPMQSVCKLPLSVAILRLADAGKLSAEDKIMVHRSDIGPYHSPIKDAFKGKQAEFTIHDLIGRALRDSDNTACDLLISRAGGATEVTKILKKAGVEGVRIDRPEGTLQPDSLKIEQFMSDPRDTTTPEAMLQMLEKLNDGKLLSKASRSLLLDEMFACETGPARIKAGLPVGWKLAHKTGTGADVSGQSAGTNDVGIAVGPKGETIYFAIFEIGSRAKIEVREALMARLAAEAAAGTL